MQNNNAVSVITGSAAQVPKETAEALGIDILPLLIYVDGKEYHDGIDISPGGTLSEDAFEPDGSKNSCSNRRAILSSF